MKTTYQYTAFLLFPFLLLFALVTGPSLSAQTNTYYVDAAKANNDGEGTSWATAKKDLQVALDLADAGDEIRVASGTYYPTAAPDDSTTDDRNKAFHLDKNVVLKGSYDPATEMQDYTNPSILSGDLGILDYTSDNAYHVFITVNLSDATTIDGFTISDGNADKTNSLTYSSQTFFQLYGGGLYNISSSPTITNSTFSGNRSLIYGGGMYNNSSSPTIIFSIFSGNDAATAGGGLYNNSSSSPTITNSTFSGNSANNGGGIWSSSSSSFKIINSTFVGNTASTSGGGLYNHRSSSPTITNSTFSGNTAKNGGGMYNNDYSYPLLYNTVLYANTADARDNLYGVINGNSSHNNASDSRDGGIDAGSGFVDLSGVDPFTDSTNPAGADGIFGTADDGLVPSGTSPLIDAGDDAKNDEVTDITGGARVMDSAIDIGAYEGQSSLSSDGPVVETITLYPNPTSSAVYLSHATATNTNYSLYDISGKRLATYEQSGTAHQLDVSSVSKGTYILKAISGLQVNYYRIVKE